MECTDLRSEGPFSEPGDLEDEARSVGSNGLDRGLHFLGRIERGCLSWSIVR